MAPIYEYICEDCGFRFESFHSKMDDNCEPCNKCGKDSHRVSHFENQNLKRPDYIPPPKATRKFGESKLTPHFRKKWE